MYLGHLTFRRLRGAGPLLLIHERDQISTYSYPMRMPQEFLDIGERGPMSHPSPVPRGEDHHKSPAGCGLTGGARADLYQLLLQKWLQVWEIVTGTKQGTRTRILFLIYG